MTKLTGTSGNDIWQLQPGTYEIDGLDGIDTVQLGLARRPNFSIIRRSDGAILIDTLSAASEQAHLVLFNIEKVAFLGGTDVVDLATYFGDITAPILSSATPAAGSTNVALGSNVVFQFDEPVKRGNGTISIEAGDGTVIARYDAATSDRLAVNGNVLTITVPSGQSASSTYRLALSAGSIVDLAGNPFAGISSHAFTTSAPAGLVLAGTTADDTLTGQAGNDSISGLDGNDTLAGGAGNDILDGGKGIDRAVFTGSYGGYMVTGTNGALVVAARTGGDSDMLTGIERLSFADANIALVSTALADHPLTAAYAAIAQKFYVSYFGRPADPNGLSNAIAQLAAAKAPASTQDFVAAYSSNPVVRGLIDSFGNSEESAMLYSGDSRNFVSAIYANVLHRAADADGLAFWAGAIDGGGLTRGQAALNILAGAESNSSPQGLVDAALVAKLVTIAGNFTGAVDTAAEMASYRGQAAASAVRALLSQVDQHSDVFSFQGRIDTLLTMLSAATAGDGTAAPTLTLVGLALPQPDFLF
jgi:Ca2+-binding RTX toxin-like protein